MSPSASIQYVGKETLTFGEKFLSPDVGWVLDLEISEEISRSDLVELTDLKLVKIVIFGFCSGF
jgi:hypothetical protein